MHCRPTLLMVAALMMPMFSAPVKAQSIETSFGVGGTILGFEGSHFFASRGEVFPFERFEDLEIEDGQAFGTGFSVQSGIDVPLGEDGAFSVGPKILGSFSRISTHQSSSFSDEGAGERFGWVSFSGVGYGTVDNTILNTEVHREIEYWTLAPVVNISMDIQSRGHVYMSFGPSWRGLRHDTKTEGYVSTTVTVDEIIDTRYAGATVAIGGQYLLTDRWSVSASAAFSTYSADVEYTGSYSDSVGEKSNRSLSTSDRANALTLRLESSYQATENLAFSIFGETDYLSYAPHMLYGTVASDPGGDVMRLSGSSVRGIAFGVRVAGRF